MPRQNESTQNVGGASGEVTGQSVPSPGNPELVQQVFGLFKDYLSTELKKLSRYTDIKNMSYNLNKSTTDQLIFLTSNIGISVNRKVTISTLKFYYIIREREGEIKSTQA